MTGAAPAILASYQPHRWDPRLHMLVWAHTGRAHVRTGDGEHYRIDEGSGIWLPAGHDHELWTEAGAVAIPAWVRPQESPDSRTQVTRFQVQEAWRDWLIHRYVLGIGPMTTFGEASTEPIETSGTSAAAPTLPSMSPAGLQITYPRMPRSATALLVAQQLVRNPALDYTVEQWAARAASSSRTLRREFLKETEMTFAQWRTRCRLAVASEFLVAGDSVQRAAEYAGFGSRNGLTRAFREHFGMTPSEYASGAGSTVSARVQDSRQTHEITQMIQNSSMSLPGLPATYTAPRINDFHVLAWTYRGEAWARVEGTTYARRRGDAIWLPAGLQNETGWSEGSLGVPIGGAELDRAEISTPLRTTFPSSWDAYLLHCSVSAYTGLRPPDYDPRHILAVFRDQLADERARTVTMPSDERARSVARDFLQRMGTTGAGKGWDVSSDILNLFRQETGMSFARWRHVARIRVSKRLLEIGDKPSNVARRVGYSRLSNYSRDFARYEGVSPRDYQRRRELELPPGEWAAD